MASKKIKKVLVAEDERALAQALNLKLSKAGHIVTVARDGEEALKFITEGNFDVAIIDLVMPKKDGFAVLEGIRGMKNKPTVVVVLSNLAQDEDRKRVLSLGAKDYFVKSNTPLSSIVEYLDKL